MAEKSKFFEILWKSQKYPLFGKISIFLALVFCKHPYFDSTNWFNNKNIVLYEVMWGQFWKFWIFLIFKGPEGGVPPKNFKLFFRQKLGNPVIWKVK